MIADPRENITQNQLEIIALYASGHQLKEIAAIKFLSYTRVRNILVEARERVGARSLAQLCSLAVEHHLIVPNGQGYKPVQEERVIGE